MDREAVWDVVVAERRVLADHLRHLRPEEWDQSSLCAGWRVRDVAAHAIAAPQMGWGPTARALGGMWRGYNGAIFRDGLRRGAAPVEDILGQFDRYAGLRRGPVTVTHVEPLIDILVHTQDILRPLGRRHSPPPEAAAVAADRCRLVPRLLGSSAVVRRTRLRATDADWERGRGVLVEGPVLELLMMCAGREPDRTVLAGGGPPQGARATGTSGP